MTVEGKLIVKGESQTFGNNGFVKRQIVIETNEQYPQKIPIDFVQGKSDLPDPYSLGESLIVSVNIRGNEYQGKYFLSAQGWKIERVPLSADQQAQPQAQQLPNEPVMPGPNEAVQNTQEEEDIDLPF